MKYELHKCDCWDRERTSLWRIDDDGSLHELGNDYGEPEDNCFYRDWDWVPEELNRLAEIINELRRTNEKSS